MWTGSGHRGARAGGVTDDEVVGHVMIDGCTIGFPPQGLGVVGRMSGNRQSELLTT